MPKGRAVLAGVPSGDSPGSGVPQSGVACARLCRELPGAGEPGAGNLLQGNLLRSRSAWLARGVGSLPANGEPGRRGGDVPIPPSHAKTLTH